MTTVSHPAILWILASAPCSVRASRRPNATARSKLGDRKKKERGAGTVRAADVELVSTSCPELVLRSHDFALFVVSLVLVVALLVTSKLQVGKDRRMWTTHVYREKLECCLCVFCLADVLVGVLLFPPTDPVEGPQIFATSLVCWCRSRHPALRREGLCLSALLDYSCWQRAATR